VRQTWWFVILFGGCAVAVASVARREREPRYDGKTLSQWLLAEHNQDDLDGAAGLRLCFGASLMLMILDEKVRG
jgi:hypothetical protein